VKPQRLATPPRLFPLLLVGAASATFSSGCADTTPITRYAEASRDVLAVAEPCLVGLQKVELDACAGSQTCEDAARERWRPVADALDVLHAAWCALAPESEGCSR